MPFSSQAHPHLCIRCGVKLTRTSLSADATASFAAANQLPQIGNRALPFHAGSDSHA